MITHLSVGDSDRRSLSPSITDVDLWVTATLERIDVDIEYRGSGAGMRTRWKSPTIIGHLLSLGRVVRGSRSGELAR